MILKGKDFGLICEKCNLDLLCCSIANNHPNIRVKNICKILVTWIPICYKWIWKFRIFPYRKVSPVYFFYLLLDKQIFGWTIWLFFLQLSTADDQNNGGICEVCITQLRNAANFKKQVQNTEIQFKRLLEEKDFNSEFLF